MQGRKSGSVPRVPAAEEIPDGDGQWRPGFEPGRRETEGGDVEASREMARGRSVLNEERSLDEPDRPLHYTWAAPQ